MKMFQIAKRVSLFIAVNVLIVATISILLHFLNVGPYLTAHGLDYASLAAMCLVWGFGGAFISLLLSRVMAKMMMGVKVINPNTTDPTEYWLVSTVHTLARQAGITKMPEVGIYDSPEVNAFATGPTKNRALVAVSSGLLRRMDKESVEGVLGHEVAHIANGDMVTMTLVQGVVNAFVMFLARAIAFILTRNSERSDRAGQSFMLVLVLQIILGFFGSMVVAYFSRMREFRADRGGAELAGRGRMIKALQSLKNYQDLVLSENSSLATLKISGGRGGIMRLFMTHPPLEERIQALMKTY